MDTPHNNRYYLTVAFGLIALVAIAYGGATLFLHRSPLEGPVISSSTSIGTPGAQMIPSNVTVVPIPTIDPQPFPTPIINGPTSPSGPSVPWEVTKMTDSKTHVDYWMAPPEIVTQVRQDYQAIDDYHRAHIFDTNTADLKQFFSEPLLNTVVQSEAEDEQRGEARGDPTLVRPELQVLGFSPDGSAVQIAEEEHGEAVPIYNRATHQLIRVEHLPVGVAISTLIYDAADKRWKVTDSRFVPGPPGLS